ERRLAALRSAQGDRMADQVGHDGRIRLDDQVGHDGRIRLDDQVGHDGRIRLNGQVGHDGNIVDDSNIGHDVLIGRDRQPGHDGRVGSDVQGMQGMQERRISWRAVMGWAAAVAAAIAAVVIFINSPEEKHEDWFAGVGEDQREICQTYYGKMADFYEAILRDDIDEARLGALESIAAENVPMVDQLPEELDPETRAAILKEYYGALLDGMERLNNSVFN
ncbi:MAG: hypothetical protein IJK70_00420, partial [Bacteroidales bacterium]|nr:hypothetical protein [Bacteroidales bacterium]